MKKKKNNNTTNKNNNFFTNSWQNFLEKSKNEGISVKVDEYYKKHKRRMH